MHHWWCAIKAFFIRQINSRKSKKSEYNTITLMLTGALWEEVKSNKLKYHPCMRSSHTNIKYFDLLSTKSSIALNFVNTNALFCIYAAIENPLHSYTHIHILDIVVIYHSFEYHRFASILLFGGCIYFIFSFWFQFISICQNITVPFHLFSALV